MKLTSVIALLLASSTSAVRIRDGPAAPAAPANATAPAVVPKTAFAQDGPAAAAAPATNATLPAAAAKPAAFAQGDGDAVQIGKNGNVVKSWRSEIPVALTFKNKSKFDVEMFWFDFTGKTVSYGVIPKRGGELKMNTYKSHPW